MGTHRSPPVAALLRVPSGAPPEELQALAAATSGTDVGKGCDTWINTVASVAIVHDKVECTARLQAAGLPVPPTALVRRDIDDDVASLPGSRFVVKPLRGAAGHGVTVGLDRRSAIQNARAFAELTGSALVQTLLGDGVDRRMFLIDGVVVAAMERRPTAHGRGSVLYGGDARPWQPDATQCRLGAAAAQAMGLDVAAVDLLDDHGRDVILEVNSCPGFAAIEAVTGVDVAGALADATLRRCGLR